MKIRLTKEFSFEMAHALHNYDGKCKNLHGHTYRLFVTIKGEPENDETNVKLGMVMDFSELKKIVYEEIISKYDHAVVLSKKSAKVDDFEKKAIFENIHFTDYQPTCENMLIDFAEKIKKRLPQNLELFSLKLYETITSYAEWYASDNK